MTDNEKIFKFVCNQANSLYIYEFIKNLNTFDYFSLNEEDKVAYAKFHETQQNINKDISSLRTYIQFILFRQKNAINLSYTIDGTEIKRCVYHAWLIEQFVEFEPSSTNKYKLRTLDNNNFKDKYLTPNTLEYLDTGNFKIGKNAFTKVVGEEPKFMVYKYVIKKLRKQFLTKEEKIEFLPAFIAYTTTNFKQRNASYFVLGMGCTNNNIEDLREFNQKFPMANFKSFLCNTKNFEILKTICFPRWKKDYYVETIMKILNKYLSEGNYKIRLVGHSYGGLIISRILENYPQIKNVYGMTMGSIYTPNVKNLTHYMDNGDIALNCNGLNNKKKDRKDVVWLDNQKSEKKKLIPSWYAHNGYDWIGLTKIFIEST